MILSPESQLYPEAQQYLGVHPATIALLKDGTRRLTWGILGDNDEEYHTLRWFSDSEKRSIQEQIDIGDMKTIQDFLNRYV